MPFFKISVRLFLSTAITLAQENQVPIIVCNMFNGSIKKVVTGENPGTTVEGD